MILDNVYMRAGMNGSIRIGDSCAINSFAKIFGHGGVTMGANSQIGPGSLVTTTSHDPKRAMAAEFKPVAIGDWVWIGANVTVLPGITIGDHAIVGAGTIVTKDVAPWSIVVGNPGRVIGENPQRRTPQSGAEA
jgi:acetyltransferase-like isoleucine patch superfamily enzyme